jgi:outer membrane protein W
LNLSVKFYFTQGRVDPYFGGGVGLYTTNFRTTSEASTCEHHCADTGPRITSRSRDAGYHALIGVDYHVTQKDVAGVVERPVIPPRESCVGGFIYRICRHGRRQ